MKAHPRQNRTIAGNQSDILESTLFLAPMQPGRTSMWRPAQRPTLYASMNLSGRRGFLKQSLVTATTVAVVPLVATAQVADVSNEVVGNSISSSSNPIAEYLSFREAVGDDPKKMTLA